jgi:hypothetical protein
MTPHITIDYTERDCERRFKILEGAKWDLREARDMLRWVNTGLMPNENPVMIMGDCSDP